MSDRIVSPPEFRERLRKELIAVADFRPRGPGRQPNHILSKVIDSSRQGPNGEAVLFGWEPRQMTVDLAEIAGRELIRLYIEDGRTLDADLVHIRNPKGLRGYVGEQLRSLSAVRFVEGANLPETIWKSLGKLIVVARNSSNQNVYVGKAGAGPVELSAFMDLRNGKANAAIRRNEPLNDMIVRGKDVLATTGTHLEAWYAESCTETFRAVEAA